jgi:predicted nucleotidyltransferase component of viral defense system
MVHYGAERPPKVEVSFRKTTIPEGEVVTVGGIRTYGIDELCRMKVLAYLSRDRIRDLYDLTFICDRYYEELSPETAKMIRDAFEYKGLDQFDYLVRTQDDELIDKAKLEARFLEAYQKVGLMNLLRR